MRNVLLLAKKVHHFRDPLFNDCGAIILGRSKVARRNKRHYYKAHKKVAPEHFTVTLLMLETLDFTRLLL